MWASRFDGWSRGWRGDLSRQGWRSLSGRVHPEAVGRNAGVPPKISCGHSVSTQWCGDRWGRKSCSGRTRRHAGRMHSPLAIPLSIALLAQKIARFSTGTNASASWWARAFSRGTAMGFMAQNRRCRRALALPPPGNCPPLRLRRSGGKFHAGVSNPIIVVQEPGERFALAASLALWALSLELFLIRPASRRRGGAGVCRGGRGGRCRGFWQFRCG